MTRGRLYLLALAMALVAVTGAHAAAVTVDCNGGVADFATLQAAVSSLTPADFNTITTTGTCAENVFINNFENLTIQDGGSGTTVQGITANASVIDIFNSPFVRMTGVDIDATIGDYGIFAFDSTVRMTASDISGAGEIGASIFGGGELSLGGSAATDAVDVHDNLIGTYASQAELNLFGHVTIEDNTEDAMVFSDAEGRSLGGDVGNIIRNNGLGVLVFYGDQVRFSGLHTIDNNGPYGLFAFRNERVVFSGFPSGTAGPPFYGTTISNHDVWGALAASTRLDFFGPDTNLVHTVSNNGAPPNDRDAGVWVGRQAEARLRNMTISNNYRHGVRGTLGAYVNLLNTAIDNNDRHGVKLSWNSTGDLGSFSLLDGTTVGPNVTAAGNGGKAIRCTKGSLLAGDRSGLSPIKCDDPDSGGSPFAGEINGDAKEDLSPTVLSASVDIESRLEPRREAAERHASQIVTKARRGDRR